MNSFEVQIFDCAHPSDCVFNIIGGAQDPPHGNSPFPSTIFAQFGGYRPQFRDWIAGIVFDGQHFMLQSGMYCVKDTWAAARP